MQIIRATVVTYSATTHTCTVQPNAGPGALLDCDVVQNCPGSFLIAGREVAVLLYPDAKAVILGPYGANADNWVLAGNLQASNTYTEISILADDTATSFTPGKAFGFLLINDHSSINIYAIVQYRAMTTPLTQLVAGGVLVEVTTGPLTGTDSTDGRFTISAHSDGKIYLENRIGSTRTVGYALIGA